MSSNVKRHYETMHKEYHVFIGDSRTEKFQALKRRLHAQKNLMSRPTEINKVVTNLSFKISQLLAQKGTFLSILIIWLYNHVM